MRVREYQEQRRASFLALRRLIVKSPIVLRMPGEYESARSSSVDVAVDSAMCEWCTGANDAVERGRRGHYCSRQKMTRMRVTDFCLGCVDGLERSPCHLAILSKAMNQQLHYIQQTHHGQHTGQTPQPMRHSLHASAHDVPFPNTPPLHTSHQQAYPAWSPPLHPSGSPGYMTQNVSPTPQASRGRNYLRSIGPAVSDLDQRFGAMAVRNAPSDLNKPLPEPPRRTQFARTTQGPERYIAASRPYATTPMPYGHRAPATASSSSYNASEPDLPNGDAAHPVDRHRAYGTLPVNSHTHHTASLPTYTPPSSSFSPHTPGTPVGAFRPSPNVVPPPHLRPPLSEPRLTRPYSDSTVPHTTPPRVKTGPRKKGSAKAKRSKDPIYVTDSEDGDTSSSSIEWVTNRSPARRRRAESERPASKISSASAPLAPTRTNIPSPAAKTPTRHTKGEAVQCSGYTKEGQKCKRMVKAKAPYFDMNSPAARAGDGDRSGEREEARYCKDHANLVIDQPGFSWIGTDVYIRYAGKLHATF